MAEKKILVVEDDRLVRSFILEGLQDLPYDLAFATNGVEGLERFHSERPDLVLIDVLLPKMSGFELCENIRKQLSGQDVPIVFMSAVYKSFAVQNEAKSKYGANDFLTKPLNLNLLRERLTSFLPVNGAGTRVAEQPDAETEVAEAKPSADADPNLVRGDLSSETFAALFFKLHRHGESGALHLRKEKVKKTIYFEEGRPVHSQSNLLGETLARTLVTQGKLTQEQAEDTRLIAKQRGKLHGQVLVNLNLIDASDLQSALEEQHRERVLNLFAWTEGEFVFARGKPLPEGVERRPLNVPGLFRQGILERMPFPLIRDRMSPLAGQPVGWNPDSLYPLAAFGFEPEERRLLCHIDGKRTLKQVLKSSDQPDHLLKLIYALAVAGTVKIAPQLDAAVLEHTRTIRSEIEGAKGVQEIPSAAEEFSLVERVAHKYSTIETANYFDILEVPFGASKDECRKAYLELSRVFHPEKARSAVDSASKDKVEAIYVRITLAYETLTDEEDREAYLAELSV